MTLRLTVRPRPLTLIVFSILMLASSLTIAQDADSTGANHGISVPNMDRSVRPGDAFYEFANGGWIKRTEIPPDRGRIGVFSALDDLSNKRTQGLIEEASKANAPVGSGQRKIGDLYKSYMDEAGIEAKGTAPLRPQLDRINGVKDKKALALALGESLRADVDPLNNTNFHTANLFGLWTAPGFEDSDHYAAYLLQGGVELPDREYYLNSSPKMQEIRDKYKAHVAAMLKLAGYDNAEQRAARVYDLEHAIAEKHRPLDENEDVHKANNTWTQADFTAKAPGLDWAQFFRGAGLSKQQKFTVWQPEAFTGESALVASQPLDAWKDWLAYHLVEEYAAVLPKAFADESFAFFGQTLGGTPQQRPRWQRGVFFVNGIIPDEVGKIFAQRFFSPDAKQKAQAMVQNIIQAFRQRINALDWMAASTKAEAQKKLDTLYVGIGYPEHWHEYTAYQVKADDVFGNLWRAELFELHRQENRLGKPVDRREWSMSPQTVNAVNLPLQNALNFPAAILQPPFFDAEAPSEVNYGAIGSVIGHEISHTFDSEGAAFDSQGRVRNWWTKEDLDHFQAATQRLVEQYNQYKPFPDISLNGKQTLAENIADVAGIAAAYDGYRASFGGKEAPEKDGFTGDQQFFIAFGQNWASKAREASLRRQVMTDPHSPGEYRCDTVRNIDAWYKAFDVKEGEKLYLSPNDRVRIW
jgi:endothelin-converting enzyme/putative endopeptidase